MSPLTQTETKEAQFIAGFDEEVFNGLNTAGEPAALRAKREAAFDVYRSLASPTAKHEEWRRTDPQLFPFGDLCALSKLERAGRYVEQEWDEQFDVVITVSDAGYTVQDRSAATAAGGRARVLPLEEAAQELPHVLEQYLQGKALQPASDKFAALNQAFWNVGFLIYVPDDTRLERGILVRYRHEAKEGILVPSLLVVAGARSSASILEQYTSPDGLPFMHVAAKEMYVGEGGQLKFITLQECGNETCFLANDRAYVEREGVIDWFTFNIGSKVSKTKFGSDVAGPGSKAELDGIFFASKEQHMDQKTLQIHSSAHTYSRLLYKGAVKDHGHSVYQGIIQAGRGAIDVDAYQTNNNLVLNDGARADTIPGLLIDADDLKCSHGATIGNVDEEQVFYLRCRGVPEEVARKIIILGYFEEIAARVPYAFLQEQIHRHIESKLGY